MGSIVEISCRSKNRPEQPQSERERGLQRQKLRRRYSGKLNAGRGADGRGGGVDGPSTYLKLAETSSSMTGFNVTHHLSSLPVAVASLVFHHWRGTVVVHEQVEAGLGAFPRALAALFAGGHRGKLLVAVDPVPTHGHRRGAAP